MDRILIRKFKLVQVFDDCDDIFCESTRKRRRTVRGLVSISCFSHGCFVEAKTTDYPPVDMGRVNATSLEAAAKETESLISAEYPKVTLEGPWKRIKPENFIDYLYGFRK